MLTTHRSSFFRLVFAALLGWFGGLSIPSPLLANPVSVEEGVAVPKVWEPGNHIYFKGQLPVSQEKLTELDQWIARRAPNWYVVLLDNTEGEALRNARGRNLTGFDAVETALNQELPAETGFGSIIDEASGEPSGVVLVLSLGDQQISYLPSQAYEVRGLGRNHWVGELDQPALSALNSGLRIEDAVKDTIVFVDQRLRDITMRQAAALESRRANVREGIQASRDQLERLKTSASAFRTAFPNASGELAAFDAEGLRTSLNQAADYLELGEETKAVQVEEEVAEQLNQFDDLFRQHGLAADRLARLEQQLNGLMQHPQAGAISFLLSDAREQLDMARRAHSLGNDTFSNALKDAEQALQEGERIVASAGQSNRIIAIAIGATLLVALLIVILALRFSRRSAKPTIDHAKAELEAWNGAFRRNSELASRLYQRCAVVIGSSSDLPRRGLTGQTVKISREVLRQVDLAWFHLAGLRTLADNASHRLTPKGFFARISAGASTKSALLALATLREGEVEIGAESATHQLRTASNNPAAELLFEQQSRALLLEAGALRHEAEANLTGAQAALDLIEKVWADLDNAFVETRQQLDQLSTKERELTTEAAEDGLLAVPALFETLIDSAERLFVESSEQSTSDPAHVLEMKLPLVNERAEVGLRVIQAILNFRTTTLPRILDAETDYAQQDLDARWIGLRLDDIAKQANDVCRLAAGDDAMHALKQFEENLETLSNESREALQIIETWRGRVVPIISQAGQEMERARKQVAGRLQLPPDRVMGEHEDQPARLLRQAELHGETIVAALSTGNVPLARETLDEASKLIRKAETSTAQYAREAIVQPETWAEFDQRINKLKRSFQSVKEAVHGLAERIPEPLLVIESFSTKQDESQVPLLEALSRLESVVSQLGNRRETHERVYRSGALFEGRKLTRQTAKILALAEEETVWLSSQIERFADAGTALNLRLNRVEKQVDSLLNAESNFKVRQSTLDRISELQASLHELQNGAERQLSSPMVLNRTAHDLLRECDMAKRLISADESLHGLAESVLAEISDYLHSAAPERSGNKKKKGAEDSPIHRLRKTHESLLPLCTRPHEDWASLDHKANDLHADICRQIAANADAAGAAGEACDAVMNAAELVRKLSAWTSDHEVVPQANAAVRMLKNARQALRHRQYEAARIQAGETIATTQRHLQLASQQLELAKLEDARILEIKRREAAQALGLFTPHTLFEHPYADKVTVPMTHLEPDLEQQAHEAAMAETNEEPEEPPRVVYPAVW